VISRLELVLLVKDVLAKHKDLFDWFKNFIGFDDPSIGIFSSFPNPPNPNPNPDFLDKNGDISSFTLGHHEVIDFKNCKQYGPSYRALPKTYQPSLCSGSTDLCQSVLNYTWVSVPTGSEDGFKNMRKNQYEEMLFRCEDDRFELDLVIELNAATVKVLEMVQKQLEPMSEDQLAKFRIDPFLDSIYLSLSSYSPIPIPIHLFLTISYLI
jgi:paired amphipathic helix protein Sin3a